MAKDVGSQMFELNIKFINDYVDGPPKKYSKQSLQ